MNTFKESDGPLSIRINASYGSGKTIFMRCLKKQAEADGFIVIYYNAWEEETSLDARSSLCLAILEKIELYSTEEKVNSKVVALQRAILPIIAKAGIAALSRFLLGDHKALLETFEAADLGNTIANALRGGLDEAQKSRNQISGIKKSLSELVSSLGNKKILILIDELDRCRPDFAIEVLETIKHFFSIKRIFSVVGVYERVLHSIIDKKYGAKIGADSYLQRHFNHTITFSKFDYEIYLRNQFKKSESYTRNWILESTEFDNGINTASKYCAYICELGNFNLRQINILINKIDSFLSAYCKSREEAKRPIVKLNLFALSLASFIKDLSHEKYSILLEKADYQKLALEIKYLTKNSKDKNFTRYIVSIISESREEFSDIWNTLSVSIPESSSLSSFVDHLAGSFIRADNELSVIDESKDKRTTP